ncbi:MAG: membrane protein insertase YidC [Paludibacteraceae bacterium]|nr:membrane protein insertase YidC [Paludibacteraceae bacterium]
MDKNTWIGFLLIAGIIVGFSMLNRPSKEQMAERQRLNDSIALARQMEWEATQLSAAISEQQAGAGNPSSEAGTQPTEEELAERLQATYGDFAVSAQGNEDFVTLENEKVRLMFTTKGGRLYRAELKEYKAYGDTVNDLRLFTGDESNLAFTLITANNRIISTQNLYFEPIKKDSVLTMRLKTNAEGSFLDFTYTLPQNEYMFSFDIVPHQMEQVLAQNVSTIEMQWSQLVPQQEKGRKFEERYAQLQYMDMGGDIDKLSEQKSARKKEAGRLRWIAYKDQFFSTVLISEDGFSSSELESEPKKNGTGYIKAYNTTTALNFDMHEPIRLRYYTGPNHYNTLKAYDAGKEKGERLHLKSLVPLGWKIVAWVNVILVIPMFDLFSSWGLHIGLIILLMTIVIKLIILPFVFKSYQSTAKMRVLKPQIDEINAKFPPEKMQERQQATMALYQKAGVSPMSGCLPMLLQMPVVMAMFWFFPTAIELRGKSFLWADDLSTYDSIISWSTPIWGIGDHLSLFCILFTVVNVVYTYITMQTQAAGNDPSQKMMKWMMYLMPLMFFFIFNDYAAGLSYYYLLALFFSILQTMIFRWTTDDAKILAEMEANAKKKANAKPQSGLMARLQKMQQEQLKQARENAKAQAKRR